MSKIFYVVNQRLTYVSCQLLLEWAGYTSSCVVYCSYHNVDNHVDDLLFEKVSKDDVLFLVGFDKQVSQGLVKIYDKYKIKTFISDAVEESIFNSLYSKLKDKLKANNLSKNKWLYIKCVKNVLDENYSDKLAYFLNIVFYKLSPDVFYDNFKEGMIDLKKFNKQIVNHLKMFKIENHSVYEYEGYYFVISSVKYIGDFVYKYRNDYDNICVIDYLSGRVYFKNLKHGSKDINNLCKKYCEDIRGFKDFCSGKITDRFLEFAKNIKQIR